jgi:hypothetical protein
MNKKEIKNRDACLPYADKVTERCDKNGTPLSNRQWEFMMDAMAELRQATVSRRSETKRTVKKLNRRFCEAK